MVKIERSIEVNVPASIVYRELSQFEEFPRFMKGVRSVHQLDDAHLHWRAERGGRELEWDAEITERIPGRCIAWRNTSGPRSEGKVVLEALEPEKTRISLSIEADEATRGCPGSPDGYAPQDDDDLARFKKMIESVERSSVERRSNGAVFVESGDSVAEWMPAVDIERHAGQLHVCADLPGVSMRDVQIGIVRDQLTIAGERRGGTRRLPEPFHAECNYGHFHRVIALPLGVDPASAQVSMHDGVLDITLAIAAAPDSARRLEIQGG